MMQRKINPIYEAIERRNYKLAAKLAKTAAQKYPESNIIKALYGVSLERQGKIEEALEIGREVCNSKDVDETTLNTLTIIFKAASKLDELTATIEKLAIANADNVSAQIILYKACARTFSYLKMQQIAMRLYKKTNDHKYVFWAVTSIYLQSSGKGKHTLLQLAESMCKKCIKEKGLDHLSQYGPDALLIYIEILYRQGKFKEALEALTTSQGKGTRLLRSQVKLLEAVLHVCCDDYESSLVILEQHLNDCPEDWHAAQVYYDLLFPNTLDAKEDKLEGLMDRVICINPLDKVRVHLKSKSSPAEVDHEAWNRAKSLVKNIEKISNQNEKSRGSHTVQLDLLVRQRRHGGDASAPMHSEEDIQIALVDAIYTFWMKCGSNTCFSADIMSYLSVLSESSAEGLYQKLYRERQELKQTLFSSVEEGHKAVSEKKKYCKIISSFELEMHLMHKIPGYVKEESLTEMIEVFKKCKPLSEGYDDRENTVADAMIMIIISMLWHTMKADCISSQLQCMLNIIMTLEFGLQQSPFNASMLLSLTLVYGALGSSQLAAEYFWKLDCKYIQLESIGSHMLLPCLLASGNEREATKFCDRHLFFHEDHDRNSGDTFVMTFNSGTYLEAIDFASLKNRLGNSSVRFAVMVERSILKILQQSVQGLQSVQQVVLNECKVLENMSSSFSDETLNSLSFNEDLTVRPEWAPPGLACSSSSVVDWWEEQVRQANVQTSGMWWKEVNAVIRLNIPSSKYRSDFKMNITFRYMLVQAMGELLSESPSIDKIDSCIHRMSSALKPDLNTMEECTRFTDRFQLVLMHVLKCSSALLKVAIQHDTGHEFLKASSKLKESIEALKTMLVRESPQSDSILYMGMPVALISTFVREVASWTILCMQCWWKIAKDLKKKLKKAKQKAEVVEETSKSVKASCQGCFKSFLELLMDVRTRISSATEPSSDLIAKSWCSHLGSVPDGMNVGWTHPFAIDIAQKIAEEQQASLKLISDRLAKYISAISIDT